MFMDGNISTGIWTTATTPRIAVMAHTTRIKYGVLIANRDMRALRFRRQIAFERDHLGLNLAARFEPGPRPHHHIVAVLQITRSNFDLARGVDPELHRNNLNLARWFNREYASRATRAIHRFHRNGEHILSLLSHQIHFGVHSWNQNQRRI